MLPAAILLVLLRCVSSEKNESVLPQAITTAGVCFDVGFNTGQDVHSLLELTDWCVSIVAIEASSALVDKAQIDFAAELQSRELVLVQAFLHDNASETFTQAQFFWNRHNNQFNSFLPSTGCRGRLPQFGGEYSVSPKNCISRIVNVTSCGSLYRKYGVPSILRLDIEGHEMACIKDLAGVNARPWLVSLEFAQVFDRYGTNMFKILELLGYRAFKRVNAGEVHRTKGRKPPNEMLDCHHMTSQWHRHWHIDTTSDTLGPCQRWSELYAHYGYPIKQNRTSKHNVSTRSKYNVPLLKDQRRRIPNRYGIVDLRKDDFRGHSLRRRTPGALEHSR
jgi:FkbM family methyltransferase